MPTHFYELMTDEDNRAFVALHFPSFLPYYDAFPYPIQRADAIRYMKLYVDGGIYIDLDIELLEDISLHMREELVLMVSPNVMSSLTNCLMASVPRHPLWLAMIEEMTRPPPFYIMGKHLTVMWTTGPGLLDRVVRRSAYPYQLLPPELFSAYCICDNVFDKKTAIRPLPGGSWRGWDSEALGFLYCHPWESFLLLLFLLLLLVVLYRWLRHRR